jgi:outer membrane biosynthesis protein TonB
VPQKGPKPVPQKGVVKPLTVVKPELNVEAVVKPVEKLVPNGHPKPHPKGPNPPKGPNQADAGRIITAASKATVNTIKSFLNILILYLLHNI